MQINLRALVLLFAFAATIPATVAKADTPSPIGLRQLMEHRYGKLSAAEDRLILAALDGETADCTDLSGDDKNIRGDLLSWLCTDPRATTQLTYKGISITRAEIVTALDLRWARIPFPITARNCTFDDKIDVSNSHIVDLNLAGSTVTYLAATEAGFEHDVHLNGFKANGGVDLSNAKIDGNLDCLGGKFIGKDKVLALNAWGMEVKKGVFLKIGFEADGGVDLSNAKIDENLDCLGGKFIGKDKVALNAWGIEVKESVFLNNGFKADGGVDLKHAKIDGHLDCSGGQFIESGRFIGDEKLKALDARMAEVKGGVALCDGFSAEGGVALTAAKIDGPLDCSGGQFIGNDEVNALDANAAEVEQGVFLNYGFIAVGQVCLLNARIDGNLELDGGHFTNKTKSIAAGSGVTQLPNPSGTDTTRPTLDLRRAKAVTLIETHDGFRDGWPDDQFLLLEGLAYERIPDFASPNAAFQLSWIGRQPHDRFRSQPFEQLADVLRKMGLEEDARNVMIAKNEEHARYVNWPEWLWYGPVGWLVGYGYDPWRAFSISLILILTGWAVFRTGYNRGLITPTEETKCTIWNYQLEPVSPLFKVYPNVSKVCPKFNAFVYSLETFVPLVKLGIADHWGPNANAYFPKKSWPTTAEPFRVYLWCHMIAGWVLSALWIGGITGLVKT